MSLNVIGRTCPLCGGNVHRVDRNEKFDIVQVFCSGATASVLPHCLVGEIWRDMWPDDETTDPLPAPRSLSDYPHNCPRCGKRAYVGLAKIEHYLEELDESCI